MMIKKLNESLIHNMDRYLKEEYDELEDENSIAYYYYNNPEELIKDLLRKKVDISNGAISDASLNAIIENSNYTPDDIEYIWSCFDGADLRDGWDR